MEYLRSSEFISLCYDLAPRVSIVDEKLVVTEHIKKEHKQINVLTQTVIRKIVRHVVFDCGHSIQKAYDTPKNNTTCYECGKDLAVERIDCE